LTASIGGSWSLMSERMKDIKNSDDKQYYVYVLEAKMAFYNGMTIPLMRNCP
jgi:hypothetical protein